MQHSILPAGVIQVAFIVTLALNVLLYTHVWTNTEDVPPLSNRQRIHRALQWSRPANLDIIPSVSWGRPHMLPYYNWAYTAPALHAHSMEIAQELLMLINEEHGTKLQVLDVLHTDTRYDIDAKGVRLWLQCRLSDGSTEFTQTLTAFREFQSPIVSLEPQAPEPPIAEQQPYVNVVVIAYRRGKAVLRLADSLQRYAQSGDRRFKLIVVDFNSTDMNLSEMMKSGGYTIDYKVKNVENQKFTRALARKIAVEQVDDPDSIIFMCDADMVVPLHLIDKIRVMTKQGSSAFSPMCYYLVSSQVEDTHTFSGGWGFPGVGNIAFYRSDYDKTAGYDLSFTDWGNEDTYFALALFEAGIEIISSYEPNFFHHPH